MFFTLCLLGTTAAGSVAIIIAGLRRAPEAYEDEKGLRIIQDSRQRPAHAGSNAYAATRGESDNSHAGTAKSFLRSCKPTRQPQKSLAAKAESFHHFAQTFLGLAHHRSLRGSNPQPLP